MRGLLKKIVVPQKKNKKKKKIMNDEIKLFFLKFNCYEACLNTRLKQQSEAKRTGNSG